MVRIDRPRTPTSFSTNRPSPHTSDSTRRPRPLGHASGTLEVLASRRRGHQTACRSFHSSRTVSRAGTCMQSSRYIPSHILLVPRPLHRRCSGRGQPLQLAGFFGQTCCLPYMQACPEVRLVCDSEAGNGAHGEIGVTLQAEEVARCQPRKTSAGW